MVVLSTEIDGLERHATGKVRDVYRIGDDALLLVATDRLSAFDVVMTQGIPDKGRVLTQLSAWWFTQTADVVPNHVIADDDATIRDAVEAQGGRWDRSLAGRCLLCKRTQPLPIEAVVRGYLSGSAWKEYRRTGGALWGHSLPRGLTESERLPQAIFTPSTKAAAGHDEPMTPTEALVILGDRYIDVERSALALYAAASQRAASVGIILADTKFEFGIAPDGEMILIDEALTPDSSRFWPADQYAPGGAQPSFDKQFVRDFLETVPGWNKQPPPPDLPDDVVARTAEKYRDAYRRLTGRALPPVRG